MTRLVVWAMLLVVCPIGLAAPKPQTPAKRFEHDVMVRFHMHQNFDLLRAVERLLIRGKLAEAKPLAAAIASAPDEPAHGPWAAQTVAIRNRAAEVARATDIGEALRKTASIGGMCGNCHDNQIVELALDRVPRTPPDQPSIEARMARHRWAADRLWEGVVGNSDVAWAAGLEILVATPFEQPADRAGIARQLQRQAQRAQRPAPGALIDRSTAYGEILATCASCHTAKP